MWDHNHGLECAKALSFRPIDPDTVTKFHSYFDQGHSPSSALHLHWLNLAIEHNDELEYVRADRSFSLQYGDIFYLYRKWRIKNHGEQNGEPMFNKLKEMIKEKWIRGGQSISSKSQHIKFWRGHTPVTSGESESTLM